VGLDRFVGDDKPGGDLGVGEAFGDEFQNLGLPGRQSVEAGYRLGVVRFVGPLGEFVNEPPGYCRSEQGVAGGDDPYGVEEPLGGGVFEQEAAGPGA
jgi:hypothetical protein